MSISKYSPIPDASHPTRRWAYVTTVCTGYWANGAPRLKTMLPSATRPALGIGPMTRNGRTWVARCTPNRRRVVKAGKRARA